MQMPNCGPDEQNLEGTFQGATVMRPANLLSNTLRARVYYTVSTERSSIRLEWQDVLTPNVVQPLTGGYFLTRWDTANPGVLYCVVAGEISAFQLPSDRLDDDYFKFKITRARSGEVGQTASNDSAMCDGAEFDVDLRGCVYRFAN